MALKNWKLMRNDVQIKTWKNMVTDNKIFIKGLIFGIDGSKQIIAKTRSKVMKLAKAYMRKNN